MTSRGPHCEEACEVLLALVYIKANYLSSTFKESSKFSWLQFVNNSLLIDIFQLSTKWWQLILTHTYQVCCSIAYLSKLVKSFRSLRKICYAVNKEKEMLSFYREHLQIIRFSKYRFSFRRHVPPSHVLARTWQQSLRCVKICLFYRQLLVR